jgi:hypothetical protein
MPIAKIIVALISLVSIVIGFIAVGGRSRLSGDFVLANPKGERNAARYAALAAILNAVAVFIQAVVFS